MPQIGQRTVGPPALFVDRRRTARMVMRAYAEQRHPGPSLRGRLTRLRSFLARSTRSSLVRAVVISRLLVLAAAAYGAPVFSGPAKYWAQLDPTRLSLSFGTIGNLLTAGVVRWDAIHYLSIASQGYKPAGDTGFFP